MDAATTPAPTFTAFDWVPDFARGLVRDLRVRWACEELGVPYSIEKFNAAGPRPEGYVLWQPFEQVPAFRDGDLSFFESGAILLYLAEKHGGLLPEGEQNRWQAIAWLFAALNSVEPTLTRYFAYAVFYADRDWSAGARDTVLPMVRQKLKRVSDALRDSEWLAGDFSVGDIMMVTVLNQLRDTDFLSEYPTLASYHARATGRPAYRRALDGQMTDFDGVPPQQGG